MAAGTITVELLAKADAFEAGTKQAAKGLQEFEKSADRAKASSLAVANTSAEAAKQLVVQTGRYDQAREAVDRYAQSQIQAEQAIKKAAETSKASAASYSQGVAFGASAAAAGEQIKSWYEETATYVEEKAKTLAIIVAVGAVSAAAAAIYSTYRLVKGAYNFISGLFSGESYKSADIDALIKINDQVKALQSNLHDSSQEAGALLNVMARLGVSKETYTSTRTAAEDTLGKVGREQAALASPAGQKMTPEEKSSAAPTIAELDRLGVVYKDANGKLLEQEKFLQNVKKALDEYTAGWDRNSAATAIGVGSYEKVVETLKVSQDEIEKSKKRIDEYNVGIGPETQASIARYQSAMREFQSELDLTGQGFSRVFADAIMPALTDLAEFFKEGFPAIVNGVRVVVSSLVAIFYGFKNGLYIIAESIIAVIEGVGHAVAGLAAAGVALAHGNFAGAADAIVAGWTGAKGRIKQAGENIVAQVEHNNAAIRQAVGNDGRNQPLKEAAAALDKGGSKKFTPAPGKPKDAASAGGDSDALLRKQLQGELQAYQQAAKAREDVISFENKYLDGEYQAGILSLTSYFADQKNLRDAGLRIQLEQIDKSIEAEKKARDAFTKPENKQEATNAIKKLEQERADAIRKYGEQNQLTLQKETADVLALSKQYGSLKENILRLQGDTAGAGKIGIDQQVQEAQKLINLVAANLPKPERLVEGPEAQQLRAGLEGQLALSEAQKEHSRLIDRTRNAEEALMIDSVAAGKSELDTLLALSAARKKTLVDLDMMVKKANELALASGTPEAIRFAEQLSLVYKRVAAEIDPLLAKQRELAKELGHTLAQGFEDAIVGGKGLREIIKGIDQDIVRAITRKTVTEPLEKSITNMIGGTGQSGGLIAKIGDFFGFKTAGGDKAKADGANPALAAQTVAVTRSTTAFDYLTQAVSRAATAFGGGSLPPGATATGGDIFSIDTSSAGTVNIPTPERDLLRQMEAGAYGASSDNKRDGERSVLDMFKPIATSQKEASESVDIFNKGTLAATADIFKLATAAGTGGNALGLLPSIIQAIAAATAGSSASSSAGGLGGILSLFGGSGAAGGAAAAGAGSAAAAGSADAAVVAMFLHSGGIAGSGSDMRAVSGVSFASAPRFHAGKGLASNEMAAVILRDEEVLTKNDPRHRDNARYNGHRGIAAPSSGRGGDVTRNQNNYLSINVPAGSTRENMNALGASIARQLRDLDARGN